MEQYSRNMGIINEDELKVIQHTNVLLIGVGGLGGYIASSLVRLGVKNITIVDFDVFEESNLNRQLHSTTLTLNKQKVEVVKEKLLEINPNINIKILNAKYNALVDSSIHNNIDIVFDAVDNIESKLFIEEQCTIHNIPLIHGAIGGWYGQLGIILPNAFILKEIYQNKTEGIEKTLKSPTFIPGIVGNMMISEFLKFILKKDSLINKILFIDVLDHEYRIIYQK